MAGSKNNPNNRAQQAKDIGSRARRIGVLPKYMRGSIQRVRGATKKGKS